MSERAKSPATWVLSNHDMPRHATRFALPQVPTRNYHQFANDWILRNGESYQEDRSLGTKRVKAALLMEMALPGSAYVYQGEELGLFEVADIPWNRLEDPVAFNTTGSGLAKGRDGCRVPLPWDSTDSDGSFGFSPRRPSDSEKVEPHLPQPAGFKDFSVNEEEGDPSSMLAFYRQALALRHRLQCPDISLEWLDINGSDNLPDGANGLTGGIIAYKRSNGWACITNFGAQPVNLPAGQVLLPSGPLDSDGRLPQDTSAWIRLG